MLTIAANGDVTYIPDSAFVGEVSFAYEVCDDGMPQSCDTVAATIQVLADDEMNDIYATDGANIAEEDEDQTGNVLDNVYDPEGDTPTVSTTPVSDVMNGTLTLNADGTYTYEPDPDFIGTDQFTYEVCDDGTPMACDTATVILSVLEMQDPPVVTPNPITILEDSTGMVLSLIHI